MKKAGLVVLSIAGILFLLLGLFSFFPGSRKKAEEFFLRDEEKSSIEAAMEEKKSPYYWVEEDNKLLEKYQEYNSDVVGILTIDGTVLNHPLMQTPDNEEYYLWKDLDKKYNSHGVPFLSADSKMEGRGGIRVAYGHNIHKRSRDVFADLAGYEELDFYKEHPLVRTVSRSGTRQWLIFAYFLVDNSDSEPFPYSDTTTFLSKKDFDAYMEKVEERNWLNVPVERVIEDTYLMLSSCSNELAGSGTNRMVVIAKELTPGEPYESAVEEASMNEAPLLPSRLNKKGKSIR